MAEELLQKCGGSSICAHQYQWERSRCKHNAVAAASVSASGRGAGVKNGGAAASAAPADQFPYHVVVHSDTYSVYLVMSWFYRHKSSSCR